MKTLLAIMMIASLGLPWLPLPPRERAGGEGGAINQPRLTKTVHCVYNAQPSPQPSPLKGEGAEPTACDQQSTFATIHITVDPQGKPLGAYQFELTSADVSFKVLGVEAGDHPAFDHGRPPYFDPVVQQDGTDRLILAEYALPELDAEQLPNQAVVVAKVSVLFARPIDADAPPAIELNLITAGDADGKKIDAKLSHTLQIPERPE